MSLVWIQRRGPKQLSGVMSSMQISCGCSALHLSELHSSSRVGTVDGITSLGEAACRALRPQTPARVPRSTTIAGCLAPPSLRASKGRSSKPQLFSALAPQWWYKLPARRVAHQLPEETQDSRVQSSPQTLHSLPPPLSSDKYTYCKSVWIKASAKCPKCKGKCPVKLPIRNIQRC